MNKHVRNGIVRVIALAGAVALLFVSTIGCSSVKTSSLGGVVPSGVDLTGIWVLDESRSDVPPDTSEASKRERAASIRGKSSNSAASIYFASQDFPVISSERLKIEQDSDSIGILYGPGKHRDLIWGLQEKAAWEIDAGWENAKLIVKSSLSHTRGEEAYSLKPNNDTLVVDVRIRAGNDYESFTRTFVRQNP